MIKRTLVLALLLTLALIPGCTGKSTRTVGETGSTQKDAAPGRSTGGATPVSRPAQSEPIPPPPEPPTPPPKPTTIPLAERTPVPILMYHEISPGPNSLYVPPPELERHLGYLQQHGFHGITLAKLWEYYKEGAPLPPNPIVLTFDDGYKSFYTSATPLLEKYGFPGTVFLITDAVGGSNFVSWDQVREAEKRGMEIGAHTVSHPDLTTMKVDRLPREVDGSKQAIEAALGHPIQFFCYPSGRQNEAVVAATRKAGFIGAVTTVPGAAAVNQDPFLWKRIRINQATSPEGLGSLIRSATGGV